jgi:two-component system response regulator NreC
MAVSNCEYRFHLISSLQECAHAAFRGRFVSSTRILIADDHSFMRRGLRTIIQANDDYEVCGEAVDGNETLQLVEKLAPDILILDISMPPPNGLEVAAQLLQTSPNTKVLIITMHDSEEILRAAAVAGASGFLLKSDAEELLLTALKLLEEGQYFVSPAFDSELAKQLFD